MAGGGVQSWDGFRIPPSLVPKAFKCHESGVGRHTAVWLAVARTSAAGLRVSVQLDCNSQHGTRVNDVLPPGGCPQLVGHPAVRDGDARELTAVEEHQAGAADAADYRPVVQVSLEG